MTLDQLKVLVAIAEQGSVQAAAEPLFRTQPTVSVALRKLENELNLTLLDRSSYRATLTAEGWHLYKKAKSLLGQAAELQSLAGYLASGHEATLTLAIEASCPMPLLLELLHNSEQNYPQTEFSVQIENIGGALERLQQGEADLAISPRFEQLESVEVMPLLSTRLMTVAVPGLLPQATGLAIDVMKKYVQIVVRDSSQHSRERGYGILDGGRRWLVNDHNSKKELILAGLGWGRLQESLIAEELAQGRLVLLGIDHYSCDIRMEICAMRRRGEMAGPVASAIWDDFRAIGRQNNPDKFSV